ncbi:uncharacterized protein LOC106164288 [Lingula anatina]|uniref:Uncharacterized protein LOC106164288 n=1 Tax=Lingula anatina TaxID=7574 RepID=A0A1S3IHC8_LINAN|nr:uncharacterized protein LOC106164288 [Lingula anatina]|eukprot:XP_013397617.1 uncharacterized protein LOC106164288 [Lingula anatina]
MGNRSGSRAKHDDERQPLASESAEDRVLPRPPRCDTEDFKIDIVPLPNCGVQVVVHDNRKSAPSNQPRDGDIVSLWSVMSNAGDGFLQVTNVKVDPDKDEYVVDMAGTLDADATKFTWQSNFPATARKTDSPQDVPWYVVTDLDPVILKIRGYQFKQDGDNTWYTITVDGDIVVAKPENPSNESNDVDASQPTHSQIFNPSRWPVYTMPEVGRNIRFNIYSAGSNVFLGASADGTARKVSQEGDPEGANYYWPNPAILFLVYDRGQP